MSTLSDRRIGPFIGACLLVLVVLVAGCGNSSKEVSSKSAAAPSSENSTSSSSTTSTTAASSASSVTPTTPLPVSASTRDRLAVLSIDDRQIPQGTYHREEWPHWADVDGNGCDARQDALMVWSVVAATVNRSGTCKVVAGSWVSPYDGMRSNNPSDFDVDHLVPLENAFRSGGWAWSTERRRAFANNPGELVVASASSNRSKGSDPPNEWRPTNRDSWCAYGDGWVKVKSAWGLTVTTAERDALGQMLDTCGIAGPVWPLGGTAFTSPEGSAPSGSVSGAPVVPVAPTPTPAPSPSVGGDVYYANCTAARAAGAAPIYAGQPGYRSALDGDKDGVACE
ncbi:unannotated protein [freshwater metagenome]|uniref:Unannotated protein n=1 Tax=freshwater metagenome TaxID=449393 RepID=A0A6J6GU35_9ZZZZ